MNAIMKAALAGVCTLGVLSAWGCDDAGTSHSPVAPRAGLPDGSRISGTFLDSVSFPESAVAPAAALLALQPEAFEATARRGSAVTDSGVLVATRSVLRGGARDVRFTREGHRARIVMRADGGGPVTHVEVYKDDSVLVSADLVWQQRNGAWLLAGRDLTVYRNGVAKVRALRRVESIQVAVADVPHLPALSASGAALLPPRLEAQVITWDCWSQDIKFFAANEAVFYAALAFFFEPNWTTFRLFVFAASLWDSAFTADTACHMDQ